MPEGLGSSTIGAKYFPNLLVVLLIILCVISFIQNSKKPDRQVEINNIGLMGLTIVFTIIYFAAWQFLGFFYLVTAIYLWALLLLYTDQKNVKSTIICAVISVGLTFATFLIFEQFMMVRF